MNLVGFAERSHLIGVPSRSFAQQAKAGGARRSRTADLLNAIQALSQLSYGPDREQESIISGR
jgi:hypothetical protein